MASIQHRRITAILLQNKLRDLHAAVSPLYALADAWNVDGLSADLPAEGEVKAVLLGYDALNIPALNLRTAIQDVAQSEETFDGIFAVPSTAFCYTFEFNGPVWTGQSQAQGFGVPLSVVGVSLFVGAAGTNGADLTVDLRVGGTSIFTTPPSIPINSGNNLNMMVLAAEFASREVPAGSIVTAHLLAAPNDGETARVNVWLKST